MTKLLTLVLVLCVLTAAWAGKPSEAPISSAQANEQAKRERLESDSPKGSSADEAPSQLDQQNLISTPPPEPIPAEARETFFYPYRQSLSPRLAAIFSTDQDNRIGYVVGFTYLWPRYRQPQPELGADMASAFGGHLNFGVRHSYFERNYFRPYYLWGLTHEVVAENHLATFTNINNYYLRFALGFEDVLTLPKSIRLELEGRAGLERQMLLLSFGYAWGF